MKLNSLLNALGCSVAKAGSEPSTNFRWWDSRGLKSIHKPMRLQPKLTYYSTPRQESFAKIILRT